MRISDNSMFPNHSRLWHYQFFLSQVSSPLRRLTTTSEVRAWNIGTPKKLECDTSTPCSLNSAMTIFLQELKESLLKWFPIFFFVLCCWSICDPSNLCGCSSFQRQQNAIELDSLFRPSKPLEVGKDRLFIPKVTRVAHKNVNKDSVTASLVIIIPNIIVHILIKFC